MIATPKHLDSTLQLIEALTQKEELTYDEAKKLDHALAFVQTHLENLRKNLTKETQQEYEEFTNNDMGLLECYKDLIASLKNLVPFVFDMGKARKIKTDQDEIEMVKARLAA